MHTKATLLIMLLVCSVVAGCITTNTSPSTSDTTTGLPQTYNVTGKNFTLMAPKVGQWVRYRVIAPNGTETSLTYTVTGKSGENFTINTTTGSKNTSQKAMTSNSIEARYDPKEASLTKVSSNRSADVLSDLFFNSSEVNANKIALQDVIVSYGNLTCIHSRIGAIDVWMSEDVPVTGLVKCVTGGQYVLLDAVNKAGSDTATS